MDVLKLPVWIDGNIHVPNCKDSKTKQTKNLKVSKFSKIEGDKVSNNNSKSFAFLNSNTEQSEKEI